MKKWELRAKRGKEVITSPDGLVGTSLKQIRDYQAEFQAERCPSCIHFDPDTGTFRQIGHEYKPGDCVHHWTDIIGQCWNYRKVKTFTPTGVQESGIEAQP